MSEENKALFRQLIDRVINEKRANIRSCGN